MPLFVFLAGAFARETPGRRDYRKIVWTLVLPLVLFQPLYIAMGRLTDWYEYSLLTPYWLLWFIASMICWRLLLPLFASPAGLVAAFVLSVAAGFDDGVGYPLSISRTLYFLPFFVLGHLYGADLVALARRHGGASALLFAAAIAVVMLWWTHGLEPSALTGSHDYANGGAPSDHPAAARIAVLALSAAAVLGFSAIVPGRAMLLRWFGERSLSIYLLHGLVVMAFVASGAPALIPQPLLLPALGLLTLLIGLATAAADGPMRRLFSPSRRADDPARAG
jgi:fucose 4-O-acetylase-like acetyltransferase